METIEAPERAMLVIPHPDDGESGCAGAVATWARQGCRVLYVVATNGDKGSSNPEMTSERLAEIREQEQRNAAAVLGVEEVVFLRHGDGELEDDRQFRGEIVREIRRHRPDILLTMDPYRRMSHTHRDHRTTGQVALDACFPYARDILHFPEHREEGLEPFKVGTVLMWGTEAPDIAVDISDAIDLKMQALAAHESQLSNDMNRIEQFAKRRAVDAAAQAADHGIEFEYAEIFRKLTFRR